MRGDHRTLRRSVFVRSDLISLWCIDAVPIRIRGRRRQTAARCACVTTLPKRMRWNGRSMFQPGAGQAFAEICFGCGRRRAGGDRARIGQWPVNQRQRLVGAIGKLAESMCRAVRPSRTSAIAPAFFHPCASLDGRQIPQAALSRANPMAWCVTRYECSRDRTPPSDCAAADDPEFSSRSRRSSSVGAKPSGP